MNMPYGEQKFPNHSIVFFLIKGIPEKSKNHAPARNPLLFPGTCDLVKIETLLVFKKHGHFPEKKGQSGILARIGTGEIKYPMPP
jgi:hypothetical protein